MFSTYNISGNGGASSSGNTEINSDLLGSVKDGGIGRAEASLSMQEYLNIKYMSLGGL